MAKPHRSLVSLEAVRPNPQPEQYADLYWRLALLERTAVVWRLHAEALFGYKVLLAKHTVSGLRERVRRALDGLAAEAQVSAADPRIGDDPPCSAREIRAFVTDLRKRVDGLAR